MTAIAIYNADGVKTGELELDPAKLDKAVRKGLLKEAVIAWQANQRQGSHKTKGRDEVAGGGKKPWKQKGTGRARQGSTRSPQWVGGGHAKRIHVRDYSVHAPAAQRAVAVRSALRHQLQEGRWIAVDGLDGQAAPKTRKVAGFLAKIGIGGRSALVVSEATDSNLHLSARNLPKVSVVPRRELNAGQVLVHTNLVFTKGALEALVKELG